MAITACRIDGRLIHGQVANLWSTKLGITRIMVIDDEVAENAIEKSGLKLAVPVGVKLSILSIAKAAENIKQGKYDSQKLFIIARGPRNFLRLVQEGVQLKEINVGNMSRVDGSKAVTKSVNVLEKDIEDFKALEKLGVNLVNQMVPGDREQSFMELLNKVIG